MYKTLVMEVRPRLQSVNVYVILKPSQRDVQISLSSDCFELVSADKKTKVAFKEFLALPESISYLHKTPTHVSFRFSTKNTSQSIGQYKTDLLVLRNTTKTTENASFLTENQKFEIQCANCSQILCSEVHFERVLPLPSENLNSADWFCHAHDQNLNLNPRLTDLFFSNTYAHVHAELLTKIRRSERIFSCDRCSTCLGWVVNPETHRLYFSTAIFRSDSDVFACKPLDECLKLIREVLSDAFLGFVRVLLHCRSSDEHDEYVLLWVVERELRVVVDDCSCSVAKVLFRCESGESVALKEWRGDASVVSVSTAKNMLDELLKELVRLNELFPEEFSMSNEFRVSYLTLYGSSF